MTATLDTVREGRRAAVWYSYVCLRKRTPHGSGSGDMRHEGWTVRLSVPRTRRWGIAAARQHPLRKVHVVRDQVVATRGDVEVRRTVWLCGADTWAAQLTSTPPAMVCAACQLVATSTSVVPTR